MYEILEALMTRSESREQAFIMIFEKMFNPEVSIEEMKMNAVECGVFILDDFAEELIYKSLENTDKIDNEIEKNLKGWKLNRLSKVSLAILRLALGEIFYFDDVPDSVTANEAVELAKKYGAEGDPAFINGLLGSVIRSKAEQ